MSLLKKLAGQTALYGLSSMLGRALNFFLVPFYTTVLLVGEFGVYTELYAYAAFITIIYLFGMETTYFRHANKGTHTELETYRVIQSFMLIITLALTCAFLLFATPIATVLQYEGKESFIRWLVLIVALDALMAIPFARLRQQNKAGFFAFAKLSNIALTITLNLFFLVLCEKIIKGKVLPSLYPWVSSFYNPDDAILYIFISNFLANAAMLFFLWKPLLEFRFRWNFNTLKPLLYYAFPLMVMGLAGMTNEVLDRILLKPLLPLNLYPGLSKEEVLGIYGGCYKLSMFMTLAIQSFRYAADPFFFSKASDKKSPVLFATIMNWFVLVCAFILIAVSIYADVLGSLFLRHPLFALGLPIVPILLLANLFLGVYYNLSIWYKLTDKTHWGTWIGLGGAGITLVGNLLLIPCLGFMGAAYTTLGCYFLMAASSYWIGKRHLPVPYSLFYIVRTLLIAIIFIIVATKVEVDDFWVRQTFRLGLLLAFLGVNYFAKPPKIESERF